MKLPGREMLNSWDGKTKVKSEEGYCEHGSSVGRWLIEWEGIFYDFQQSNNLQKDFWLERAEPKIGKLAALKCLRWLCHECGEIQKPPKRLFEGIEESPKTEKINETN